MAEPMIQLVYASAATAPMNRADLQRILDVADRTNAELGITGMLLYDRGSFFQVLEGPRDAVSALYARIGKDRRHDQVLHILTQSITRRDFPDWSMSYPGLTAADLAAAEGLSDFFNNRTTTFCHIDPTRARVLLEAFRNGIFHMSEQGGVTAA